MPLTKQHDCDPLTGTARLTFAFKHPSPEKYAVWLCTGCGRYFYHAKEEWHELFIGEKREQNEYVAMYNL